MFVQVPTFQQINYYIPMKPAGQESSGQREFKNLIFTRLESVFFICIPFFNIS